VLVQSMNKLTIMSTLRLKIPSMLARIRVLCARFLHVT
jgi:hypothetical protein